MTSTRSIIAYLNASGTFDDLCSVLDGVSRAILHFEIRESMKESEVEMILQRAREKYPDTKPRIIRNNGPQFVARAFKDFMREAGMTHVRTSPYYPQSNGKIERWHKTMTADAIRLRAAAAPRAGHSRTTEWFPRDPRLGHRGEHGGGSSVPIGASAGSGACCDSGGPRSLVLANKTAC